MNTYIFNYVTTNIVNGKQYVGMHQTRNLNDGYLGSGIYLNEAIAKYGKKNFKRDIICFCSSRDEAHKNEGILIGKFKSLKPCGYNLSPKGGLGCKGSLSEESKEKISKNNGAKRPEIIEKCRAIALEKTKEAMNKTEIKEKIKNSITQERRDQLKQQAKERFKGKTPWLGRKHSEETKQKMRKPHKK